MNISKTTQERRVLEVLQEAPGEWVSGQYFLRTLYLSQYHRAIWNLQHRRDKYEYAGVIEASPFTDEFGFKSYRISEPVKEPEATGPKCQLCGKAGGHLLPLTRIHFRDETLAKIPSRYWFQMVHSDCAVQHHG